MKNKDITSKIENIQSQINLLKENISLENTGYDEEQYNYCKHYFEEANDYLNGIIYYLKKAGDDV